MVNFSGATADAGDKYTGLDRFGRVADQRWTQGTTATSPVLDRYGYTYDRNSNRLTRSNPLAAAFSETYAYDALNQLQSFSRGDTPTPTTSQQWQFDALGNWTTVTTNGVAQNRTANAQNELTQASGKTLTYTPTGSMATDVQGRTFTYDAWNRLVSVKNATGTEVARYEYDGLARRIVERVGTLAAPAAASAPVRDVYYSQNWQVLEERLRTPAGAIPTTADTRFVWSPVYVDAMVVRDRNADGNTTTGTGGLEERVYAIQDANWNTTAIIAAAGVPGMAAGAVINRFIYAPYGRSDVLTAAWATAGASTPTPWAHRFQGLEFTDVTNLFHARNRDYSFALGRFIQLDPIGFSAGDSNWYRFVGNGPTGKVDPSGLCEPDDVIMGLPMDYWFPMPPQPATGPRVENGIVVDEQGIPLVSGPLRPGDIGTSAGGSQFDNFIEAKRIAKEKIHEVAIDVAINTAAAGIPIGSAGRVAAQGRNAGIGKLGKLGKYGDEVAAAGRCAEGTVNVGNLRKLKDSRLKELAINAEDFKKSIVGNGGNRFNIAVGDNGEVFLTPVKKTAGPPIPTHTLLDDLPTLFPRAGRQ
jgi:RHS repeat-associated protein